MSESMAIMVDHKLAQLIKREPHKREATLEAIQALAISLAGEPEDQRATLLHSAIDQALAAAKATAENTTPVSCRKGCNHCCRLEVGINAPEAGLLLQRSTHIDWARLHKQAEAASWNDLQHKDRACVFLSQQGTCTVYEQRPATCRLYQVVSAPELCDTERFPGGEVAELVNGNALVFLSASQNVHATTRMARALLAAQAARMAEYSEKSDE